MSIRPSIMLQKNRIINYLGHYEMQKHLVRNILFVCFQLFLLVCALYIGREWSETYGIIPKFLFRLPEQSITPAIFSQVLNIFIVFGAIFYSLAALKLGPVNFNNVRRTIQELFTTLLSFTFCTLYIFFATSLPFSPDHFVGTGLVYFLLLICAQFMAYFFGKKQILATSWLGLLKAIGVNLLKTVSSLGGILILLFAASPLILMKAYISNRDVANIVTQIRLSLTQETYEGWLLINAVPDLTFRQPIMAQFSPNNDNIVFVLERHGRLYKVNYAPDGKKTLVLDFSSRVGEVDMENGALGFDLHPEFGQNGSENSGYVYVYYTDYNNIVDKQQTNRLARFNLDKDTLEARLASEAPLVEFKRQSDGYHNGGAVEFGPDSFLYLAVGESSNRKAHQKINHKLNGGIFRIDVDKRGGNISHPIRRQAVDSVTQGYFIPSDNPFVGQKDALEEFWALGLRNPFRFSFDAKTNKIWAGDVGSTRFEEINIIEKGGNYQFPYVEGVTAGKGSKPEQYIGVETGPAYFYEHTAYERSIIGGLVYRDDKNPELTGKYIYMDNYSGKIYTLNADDERLTDPETLTRSEQVAQRGITSLIAAPGGDILITTLGRSEDQSGRLLKLVPSSEKAMAQMDKQQTEMSSHSHSPETVDIKKLYNVNCARCHGIGGMGDGPDKEHLETLLPDFTLPDFHEARPDDILFKVIKNGGEAEGLSFEMPPWDGILEDGEVREIIKYLRSLKKTE